MEGGLGFHAGEDRANEDWMLAADATGMGVLDQSKEHFFFFSVKKFCGNRAASGGACRGDMSCC